MTEASLPGTVAKKIHPFRDALQSTLKERLISMAVTGRAALVTEDFSDDRVESVVVLDTVSLDAVEQVAPLGRKFVRRGVASPLLMSRPYIAASLDVFPLEFLEIKRAHLTIHGDDVFDDLSIEKRDLRRQCERELKSFLIRLRQGYLASTGQERALGAVMRDAAGSLAAVVRGILHLLDEPVRLAVREDFGAIHRRLELTGEPIDPRPMLHTDSPATREQFERIYNFAVSVAEKVDRIS